MSLRAFACSRFLLFILPLLALAAGVCGAAAADDSIRLGGTAYYPRFSNADQHEFTPRGQEDTERWTDMLTVTHYREVRDQDALAKIANTVLGRYKANRALVVKTRSEPQTTVRPAEHLIIVIFPMQDYIQAVFTRFRMIDGMGCAIVYSHRERGRKPSDRMSSWLKKKGELAEAAVMALEKVPSPDAS